MKELSTVHFQSCLISLSERSPGTLARHLRSILLHLGCFITLLWWGGDGGSEVQCSCAWSQHSYCSSAESGWLLPLSAESCAGVPKHPNAADCGQAWKSSRCVQREAWELVPLVWCRPVYTGEPVLQGISRIPCAVLLCLGYSPFLLHQRTAEVKKFLLCGWYILTQLFLGWLYWVIKQEHLPQIVRGTRVRSWRLWNFKYKVLLIFVVHVKSLHTVPQAIDFYGFKLYRIPLRARNLLCFFSSTEERHAGSWLQGMENERKPFYNLLVDHECLQDHIVPLLAVALYKWDPFHTALASWHLLHQASILSFANSGARGTFIPLVLAWHLNRVCVVYTSGTRLLQGVVPPSRAWQGEPLEQPSRCGCTHGCPFSLIWPSLPQPPKSQLLKKICFLPSARLLVPLQKHVPLSLWVICRIGSLGGTWVWNLCPAHSGYMLDGSTFLNNLLHSNLQPAGAE